MNSSSEMERLQSKFLEKMANDYCFSRKRRDVFINRFHPNNKLRENQELAEVVYRDEETVDWGQSFQYHLNEICKELEKNCCQIHNLSQQGRPRKGESPWEQAFKWLWETKFPEWRAQWGAVAKHWGDIVDVEDTSHFYVERVPYEAQCYEAILQPGALIRIKAPEQMGKTWFLQSIIRPVRELDYRHLTFDFNLLNGNDFSEVQRFLQSFCVGVSLELGLPDKLDDYWNNRVTYNQNSTVYFQNYLLAQSTSPLVLVLKHIDSVFEHPVIAIDFCNLLRSWHDKARSGERVSVIWQRLRLVVVHSTDVYATLDINHSPLANVGTTIKLQDFSEKQIQDLARRYGLTWDATQLKKLMDLVEGHPYLVNHALKHIAHQGITLDQFLETASTDAGIYSDHLRRLLGRIISRPELATALRRVVTTPNPVRLESIKLFKLDSMGLVKLEGNDARPRCNLYRRYFRDRLSQFEI